MALFFLGRRRQAVEQLRKTLGSNQKSAVGREVIARCFARQGQYEQAIAEMRRVVAAPGSLYGVAVRRDEALRELAELKRRAGQRRVSQVYLARLYAGLEDKESALNMQDQSYAGRSDAAPCI